MKTGIELIQEERQRQIEKEGWDKGHDDFNSAMELSGAAACYIANAHNKMFKDQCARFQVRDETLSEWVDGWPFNEEWDKREKHDVKRSLIIAGALIAAELDRLIATERG